MTCSGHASCRLVQEFLRSQDGQGKAPCKVPSVPGHKTCGSGEIAFNSRYDEGVTEAGLAQHNIEEISSLHSREGTLQGSMGQDIYRVALGKIGKQFPQLRVIQIEGQNPAPLQEGKGRGGAIARLGDVVEKGSVDRKVRISLVAQIDDKTRRINNC